MLHVQAEPLQTICAPSSDFVVFQLLLYECELLLCQGGWHMHQWIFFLDFTQVPKHICDQSHSGRLTPYYTKYKMVARNTKPFVVVSGLA